MFLHFQIFIKKSIKVAFDCGIFWVDSLNFRNIMGVEIHISRTIYSPNETAHDKTKKMECAPSEDSGKPGHSPKLIRVFAVRMKKS